MLQQALLKSLTESDQLVQECAAKALSAMHEKAPPKLKQQLVCLIISYYFLLKLLLISCCCCSWVLHSSPSLYIYIYIFLYPLIGLFYFAFLLISRWMR